MVPRGRVSRVADGTGKAGVVSYGLEGAFWLVRFRHGMAGVVSHGELSLGKSC